MTGREALDPTAQLWWRVVFGLIAGVIAWNAKRIGSEAIALWDKVLTPVGLLVSLGLWVVAAWALRTAIVLP